MTQLQPRPRYCLVFAVRGKKKLGGLYTAPVKGSIADFHAVIPVTIAAMGDGCHIAKEGAAVGSKGYVIDAYEFTDVPKNIWPTYCKLLPPARVEAIEKEAIMADN